MHSLHRTLMWRVSTTPSPSPSPPSHTPAQTEVESYFITAGLFYPSYMPSYWIGLRSSASTWPRFQWASSNIPPPAAMTYEHWGLSETVREPDNRAGNEFCGAGNYTQAYGNAWAWSDFNCSVAMPFVCRQDGRHPGSPFAHAACYCAPAAAWPQLHLNGMHQLP
jgi:hypothetical protein